MTRKTAAITKSKAPRKPTAPAEIVAVRVPAPGEGKRGEQGYLAICCDRPTPRSA